MAACLCKAYAIDILPRDYLPAAAGTNLTALYYLHSHSNTLNVARGGTITSGTSLESELGVFRQIYYGAVDGRSWAIQLVVPFGSLQGKIAGQRLQNATGVGDVLLAAGISLLPHPEPNRNIGIVLYAAVPTGNYSRDRSLNLGANRWSADFQLGYTQGIGGLFWFDAAADAILYTINNSVAAGGTSRKQPTYQAQVWLSVVPDAKSLISVGYAAQVGGTETLGAVGNGVKTESQQVRAAYTRIIAPNFNLVAQVTRDIHVVGGFKQNFGLTLRAAYLF